MEKQLIYLLAFIAGYILLLLFCECLGRWANVRPEHTRKLAHIVSTLSTLLYPQLFSDHIYPLLLCLFFCITLLITKRLKIIPSIDRVERKTEGSYMLALAVGTTYYLSIVCKEIAIYQLPILVLAISDPLAGIVGQRVSSKRLFNGKTFVGSLSFFLSAFAISFVYLITECHPPMWGISVLIALSTTIVELFSPRGLDNLTIPLTIVAVLFMAL